MKVYPNIKSFLFAHTYLVLLAAWLITISFIAQYYWTYSTAPEQVRVALQKHIAERTNDFESWLSDKAVINRLLDGRYTKADFETAQERDYYLFLSGSGTEDLELRFWNTHIIVPTTDLWLREDGQWFEKLINGYYVVNKRTVSFENGKTAAAIALIPVKWEYFITTDYLNNDFAYLPQTASYYTVSFTTPSPYAVSGINGKELFWLAQRPGVPQPLSPVTVIIRLLGVLVLLVWLQRFTVHLRQQVSFTAALLFLVGVLLSLRILTYLYPVPFQLRQFELFDPAVYGSNIVLKSLGDLLLNSLLVLWVLLFVSRYGPPFRVSTRFPRWMAAALVSALVYGCTLLFGHICRTLVADSQISFNITDFFSLNRFSFIGFVTLGCLSAVYFLLLMGLLRVFHQLVPANIWQQLLLLVVPGFLYMSLTLGTPALPFNFSLLLWLLLINVVFYAGGSWLKGVPLSGRTVLYLFLLSFALTLLIAAENSNKEWMSRKRIAEKLSMQTDPAAENLLSIALSSFRGNFLQDQFSRFTESGANRYLKDSLLNENFSGYLNKYDTRIFTFDGREEALFNDDSTSFNTLTTIYSLQSKPTTTRDWRYFEESFDRVYYIARKEVVDTVQFKTVGTIFIISKPKTVTDDKFYPELFSRKFNQQNEYASAYAYALYKRGELVSSMGDYNFSIHLTNAGKLRPGFEQKSVNGYSELWYRPSGDRAVVVVRKVNSWLQVITLFAYLFLTFLLLWVTFNIITILMNAGWNRSKWKQVFQLNFRTQVHATIIAISIISFLVIGVSTIFFFINRHNRTNRERLARTIQLMQAEVKEALETQALFDDMLKVYDEVSDVQLQARLNRISEIHGVDVNIYDPGGNLRLSSQPYYYNKGLLSRKMEPQSFYQLSRLFVVQHIETEYVGAQSYLSIYVPVRDGNGQTYAYVNIPYFTSQNELRLEISSFLVTLINLNAFIFLVAGLIAFLVTNRITASFSFISERMKLVKLGNTAEPIVWNRNDEIGELVNEYNKMVNKLQESAALLAKSEREGAWREMARQVAHEIKNPLTPMKLSIQYLQKAVSANSADAKTISQNVARTLVEQIDYLSNIASDFSNFANIGNPRMERVNLTDSLKSVADLFTMDERAELFYDLSMAETVFVQADKTQLNRLFTNLIRNAIEAVPPYRKAKVELRYVLGNGDVIVEIKDNGDGIPEELQGNIFYPNFTTKTSGTGLGLAMCKGIVEQMKGSIWFETRQGNGTSFFVRLPRA